MLANLHRRAGNMERWKSTLESYLEIPDDGLGHAQVHKEIAEVLMAEEKWDDAEPHALAAAQTWSSWGLHLASQCYEGMGEWDKSEAFARNNAEAYGRHRLVRWYFWCRRTGRGDVRAAKVLAERYIRAPQNANNLNQLDLKGTYYQLEGNPQMAMKVYQAGIEQ